MPTMFRKQIGELKVQVEGLLSTDLEALNSLMKQKGIAHVVPKS